MSPESFIDWIFCCLQITILGTVALLLGCLFNKRRPELAVITGVIALATGSCLVLLTVTGTPRLWTVATPTHIYPLAGEATETLQSSESTPAVNQSSEAHKQTLARTNQPLGLTLTGLWSVFANSLKTIPPKSNTASGAFWLAVGFCSVLLIRFGIGCWALLRLKRTCVPFRSLKLSRQVETLAAAIQLRSEIRLVTCPLITSPCVTWLSPRMIFLPLDFETWSEDERNSSLAHELAHIKRRDTFWRMISELAWIFTCWHPLMFQIRRQVTESQELSADRTAVQALGCGSRYRKGLTKLALRLDAQASLANRPRFYLSTSILSSSLIRRIKMLKRIQTPVGASPLKQNLVAGVTLLACCWLCCWSARAQTAGDNHAQTNSHGARTSTQTDQDTETQNGIRVAKAERINAERTPFSRPIPTPWEDLGRQPGYASIQVADLLSHPSIAEHLPLVWNGLPILKPLEDGTRPSLSDFGLPIEALTRVDFALNSSFRKIPEADRRDDGAEDSWSISSQGGIFHTQQAVDWPRLIGALELQHLGLGIDNELLDQIRSQMEGKIEIGNTLQIPHSIAEDEIELNSTQKQMWQHVGGGVATLYYHVQSLMASAPDLPEGASEAERSSFETQKSVASIAIGVDIPHDSQAEAIRFALEPVEGTSATELANKVKGSFDIIVEILRDDHEHSESQQLADLVEKLKVTPVKRSGTSFVSITGNLPVLWTFKNQVLVEE